MGAAAEDARRPSGAPGEFGSLYRLHAGRLEEARGLIDALYYPCRWTAPRSAWQAPVDFTGADLDGLTISATRVGGTVRISSEERDGYHVDLPRSGRLRCEFGDERLVVSRAEAVIFPFSGLATAIWSGPRDEPIGVKLDAAEVETELEGLLGHPISRPIPFGSRLDTASGAGRSWADLIRFLYDEVVAGRPLTRYPLMARQLCSTAVTGLLLAADHPYHEELATPVTPARPRTIKRAIDLIESYPDMALTVSDLAWAAGCGVRALQQGFRDYVGVTPMDYLRQVRLTRARDDLRLAPPGTVTVAHVAHRWGFSHLGRFAAAYRAAFGESPSDALRREP
jgi:AraC-like DNA-binding protein